MSRTVTLSYAIISMLLICAGHIRAEPCVRDRNLLVCSVMGTAMVDISSTNLNGIDQVHVIYAEGAVLSLKSPSTSPILIKPSDGGGHNSLQIALLDTMANRVQIQIQLSSAQLSKPLFTATSSVGTTANSISITVKQMILNAEDFELFDHDMQPTLGVESFEVIFDNSTANSGELDFSSLIRGLKTVTRVTIVGNMHRLSAETSDMPTSLISINELTLRGLRLNDQLLYNTVNLRLYVIENCEYSSTGQFLKSNRANNVTLIMKNNNPVEGVLPNRLNAFKGGLQFHSITLKEPKLDSACLNAFKDVEPRLREIVLGLGNYSLNDMTMWQANRPYVWTLKILNIRTLDIFPSKFFNKFDVLHKLVLQGTFNLEKRHICVFANTIALLDVEKHLITLDSPQNPSNWSTCADTYVRAINIQQLAEVYCPPDNTFKDCGRWCAATAQCALAREESLCPGTTFNDAPAFFYNTSRLNYFFENRLWSDRPNNETGDVSDGGSIHIGAIIGAICGLLIAIIVFGITVFCIYQHRQKNVNKNAGFTVQRKYVPSSDDSAHVSIATSKTSQSSRYALENAFFPVAQPNNEVAPPLYTAPSESAHSTSVYNLPSAPRAPRDSVSTHATHVYETVDP